MSWWRRRFGKDDPESIQKATVFRRGLFWGVVAVALVVPTVLVEPVVTQLLTCAVGFALYFTDWDRWTGPAAERWSAAVGLAMCWLLVALAFDVVPVLLQMLVLGVFGLVMVTCLALVALIGLVFLSDLRDFLRHQVVWHCLDRSFKQNLRDWGRLVKDPGGPQPTRGAVWMALARAALRLADLPDWRGDMDVRISRIQLEKMTWESWS